MVSLSLGKSLSGTLIISILLSVRPFLGGWGGGVEGGDY